MDEERFLKQKSKVQWLAVGDSNSAFFHSSLKSKTHRSRIDIIMDGAGVLHEGKKVDGSFVYHYEKFLNSKGKTSLVPPPDLFSVKLDDSCALNMVCPISSDEIKRAMFSIGDNKALGLMVI